MVSLTELVLGKEHEAYLRGFLAQSIARLNVCAANPDQVFTTRSDYNTDQQWAEVTRRNFGTPVPLEALDPTQMLDPPSLELFYRRTLLNADWRVNPYLAPTQVMLEAGFAGDPFPVGR